MPAAHAQWLQPNTGRMHRHVHPADGNTAGFACFCAGEELLLAGTVLARGHPPYSPECRPIPPSVKERCSVCWNWPGCG